MSSSCVIIGFVFLSSIFDGEILEKTLHSPETALPQEPSVVEQSEYAMIACSDYRKLIMWRSNMWKHLNIFVLWKKI